MADPSSFEPLGDFIDGAFRLPEAPAEEIPLEDPGDLDALAGRAFPVSADGIDEAVEAARRAFPAWRDTADEERAALLRRFALELESDKADLARLIATEVGKPLWEARTEVDSMIAKVKVTLGEGLEMIAERRFTLEPGRVARVRPHARGVMAVLGPFNFPGHLPHGHVVPALATGNAVVFKPSERAPAVGQRYAELARRAGFPPGVVNVVQGGGEVGQRLAEHEQVDGVLFTGSYRVGRHLLGRTLDQPWKILALEMGGKNGIVVADDADLDAAIHAASFGATATAGQRCSSTSRVIVQRRVAAEFLGGLVRVLRDLVVGHPLDDGVFMGPLISAEAATRHAELHDLARQEKAECLLAGGPCEGPRRGHYVRPSVHQVPAARRGSWYQMEEHFVPDVCVLVVEDFEEALAALDATEYGLCGSVFTGSRARWEKAARESRVGVLNWNAATVGASGRLPFGGLRRSGNDRPAGIASAVYCTFLMASIEVERPQNLSRHPGFPWPR